MAGIMANSVSKQMLAGDTAPSQTVTGFVAQEQVTLSVTPAFANYQWGQALPAGSSAAKSAISDTASATPAFTPDVTGLYTITCTDGATSYTLVLSVMAVSVSCPVGPIQLLPVADSQVATPSAGVKLYCSSTQGGVLAIKKTTGAVETVDTTPVV